MKNIKKKSDNRNTIISNFTSKNDSYKIYLSKYRGKLISFQIYKDLIFHADEKGKLRCIEILKFSLKFPDFNKNKKPRKLKAIN
ncbi:MAG TPA: hypothetical protein PK079_21610 [Leptospiraceae bacterium]|nr:hypothetical protein [Leptospiraceae bacterium]HMW08106.1 hypothetical protein [Leptospiraceae bacterium]HMY33817.1 hypothetical protein [Leptospiraceae bacterium]HMZ65928.1 hypothetical protein [Leptospiraceae bacterium]HNA08850.1 hypothetical protein [Leptospiraceae bacterium]